MTKTEWDRDLVRRCIVEKWALLVAEPNQNAMPTCPLCEEYGGRKEQCRGCPIREKTGIVNCGSTPYAQWERAGLGHRTSALARAECDFLWELHDDLTAKMLEERGGPDAPATQLDGRSVTITARVDDEQNLGHAVPASVIANAIYREHGVGVAAHQITLTEPITTLGVFDVVVKRFRELDSTVKAWVVEETPAEKIKSGIFTCKACAKIVHSVNGHGVCSRCACECYDADGHYLVPVVRGGPWKYNGRVWECYEDERWISSHVDGFKVNGDWVIGCGSRLCCVRPSIVLYAPRGYDGPLPEGCRWAAGSDPGEVGDAVIKVLEGSHDLKTWTEVDRAEGGLFIWANPPGNYPYCRTRILSRKPSKPYKVLEGSVDGKLWFEITRTNAMDAYLHTDARTLHSTRVRTVDAGGKTTWTDETVHKPPKTKAAPDIRPNDRVFVNKISDALNGERGIVVTAQRAIDCYRVVFDDDTVRHYHAVEIRLEREMTGSAARISTRAAVEQLGRIVSDMALMLKRRSTADAYRDSERQAERLLERLGGGE